MLSGGMPVARPTGMRHACWASLFWALLSPGGLAVAETDRAALPSKLERANDEEAVHRIESLANTVAGLEWTEKHEELAEDVGRELYDSLDEVDDDWDAQGAVIDALGAVGGRYARHALPRIAFREAREGPERRMRVRALHAAGRLQAVCRQHTISHPGAWRQWWDENEDNPEAWRDENQ